MIHDSSIFSVNIFLWLSSALAPCFARSLHSTNNMFCCADLQAVFERIQELWKGFTVFWATQSAVIVDPAGAGWAEPAVVFRWGPTNSITANIRTITFRPVIVAFTAILAEADHFHIICVSVWCTLKVSDLPTAILLIVNSSIEIRLGNTIVSRA